MTSTTSFQTRAPVSGPVSFQAGASISNVFPFQTETPRHESPNFLAGAQIPKVSTFQAKASLPDVSLFQSGVPIMSTSTLTSDKQKYLSFDSPVGVPDSSSYNPFLLDDLNEALDFDLDIMPMQIQPIN